jgi:glucose-1-phosphate thymidylyltransferase
VLFRSQKISGQFISKEAKVSPTAVLEGPVLIEDGAVIDHYTVIKGPVYIGKRSFIGAHSLVRNYVSLEESSVLGSGVEVKRSYIGPRVTIGSNCLVTDSILGENATFKPFVVTLNYDPHEAKRLGEFYIKRGVILGKGSLINGGSVLKPGTIIESRKIYP